VHVDVATGPLRNPIGRLARRRGGFLDHCKRVDSHEIVVCKGQESGGIVKISWGSVCGGLLLLLFLFGHAAPVSAIGSTTPPMSQQRSRELEQIIQDAIAETRKEKPDAKAVGDTLRGVLADPIFHTLPDNYRRLAYAIYGAVLFDQDDYQAAQAPIVRATEFPEATEFEWHLRFGTGYRLKDYADAAVALTALARKWPEKLADYNDVAISQTAFKAEENLTAPGAAGDLLEALFAARWRPSNQFSTPSGLWLALARIRLQRGDLAGAKEVIGEIKDPEAMLQMHADKRFDPIVRARPSDFDVMKAYQTWLAQLRALVTANPDKLEGANTLAELLLKLDRNEEALTVTSAAIRSYNSNSKFFSDGDDQINWALDVQSRTLFALGRSEEAFAALGEGAGQKEHAAPNVSQAINLADQYNLYDRPQEALKSVQTLDGSEASDYGKMALADARACAFFQLADRENLAKTLKFMKENAGDGSQPYLNAMLFVGDLDAVAIEVIAELRNPQKRLYMLEFLQTYLPSHHPTKRESAIHAAWLAVRARPEVAAEISKVGRVESYPLRSPSY